MSIRHQQSLTLFASALPARWIRAARWTWIVVLLGALPGTTAAGQTTAGASQSTYPKAPPLRINVPTVLVTAQKEPQTLGTLPVSATTLTSRDIALAGVGTIGEAGAYAPNTFFTEFAPRRLSFPRFRGIGTSPSNPGITTYIDGVPQLSTNTSSTELLDIEQIEFVRGPQSALFGRNALGGVINVSSARPLLTRWTGAFLAPFGNAGTKEIRGSASGPLGAAAGISVAIGRSVRDGFNTNDVTGHDVDGRAATFAKAQVLWTPASAWEVRAIVSGERARDGDYALNDLGALRSRPYHVARDFEGRTDRNVLSTTVLTRREGARVALSTTTCSAAAILAPMINSTNRSYPRPGSACMSRPP